MLSIKAISDVPEVLPEAKALYKRAFPRRERIPFSIMTKDNSGISEVFALLDEHKVFVALCCLLNNIGITHITYLAVEESQRDHGYGSEILKLIHEQKPGRRIIVDIEMPEEDAPNEDQRLMRKKFYLRAGYEETEIRYNWRGEDYQILTYGGNVTEEEFERFWDGLE